MAGYRLLWVILEVFGEFLVIGLRVGLSVTADCFAIYSVLGGVVWRIYRRTVFGRGSYHTPLHTPDFFRLLARVSAI
ncbi:hypothetical protein [Nostoc sp.]|uniref:hypothetical protein n=1 Tax=Nostoc sp. TaxID=1180 RepID=UPI002FF8D46D